VATLHTGTKLVVVDVVVRDKAGHAVHGLMRDDLVVLEAGKPQTVRSFDEYSTPAVPPAIPAMPKLPPGLFTNLTPAPAHGPLNVLLIDGINTPIVDQQYLRLQLLDYTAHLAPGTRIAIFGLAPNHLFLLQGFTGDPATLHALLAGFTSHHTLLLPNQSTNQSALTNAMTDPSGGPSAVKTGMQLMQMSGGGTALMTSATDDFMQVIGVAQDLLRVEHTIEAFTNLGRWLLNFPGRKNVIWFSAAFPLGVDPNGSIENQTDIPGEDSDVFRAMTNLLTRAQVSVYPVDPRGVQVDPGFGADGTDPSQITARRQTSASFYANNAAEHATMQAVASDTGGAALYNRNNLSQATADAIENGANYYTLSYTPNEQKTGGEWRSIRVELAHPDRFKGAQLQYRRGYFADNLRVPAHKTGSAEVAQDPNAPSVESRVYSHAAMLHGAPPPQDIPFTTRVLPASMSTEQTVAAGNQVAPVNPIKPPFRRYDVDCAASARYFTLSQAANGQYVGAVQAAVLAYDINGKLLNSASRTLRFDLTPQEYADFQRLGFREHLEISVPDRTETFLRVGIEERTTGRIGAVEVPTSSVLGLAPPDYASQVTKPEPAGENSPR
jgi:VWFA-related protein